MIIHILKNGDVLEDMTGYVVKEDACPLAYNVIDGMNYERGGTYEKKQDQEQDS